MLSPITRTVTVAPLTISTCGAGAVPRATASISLPISLLTASRMRPTGMPTSTMGSLCSTSLRPVTTPLGVNADQKLDRLAGIAGGVGEVGVQVDEAEKLIVLVGAHDCGIALRRPEAIRTCNELRRLGLAEVIAQPTRGARLSNHGNPAENGQSANKDKNVDELSQGACFQISAIAKFRNRTPLSWIENSVSLEQRAASLVALDQTPRTLTGAKYPMKENPTCAKSRF